MRVVPAAIPGVPPTNCTSWECLDAPLPLPSRTGSFDCVDLRFAKANSAQDDNAKRISAPHFSAMSPIKPSRSGTLTDHSKISRREGHEFTRAAKTSW